MGDVVGTGSSELLSTPCYGTWVMIFCVPNKRQGGVVLGGKIAPIFFSTPLKTQALPIECDVTKLNTGDIITIKPYEGKILNEAGEVVSTFEICPVTLPG